MSTPTEHAAFELGYKCCEKGMNLEAAFEMLNKITAPATVTKAIDAPLPTKPLFRRLPEGYAIFEYLTTVLYDHRLEWSIEQLRAFNVKYFAYDDVRIFPLWDDEGGVRLVLIGKPKVT